MKRCPMCLILILLRKVVCYTQLNHRLKNATQGSYISSSVVRVAKTTYKLSHEKKSEKWRSFFSKLSPLVHFTVCKITRSFYTTSLGANCLSISLKRPSSFFFNCKYSIAGCLAMFQL